MLDQIGSRIAAGDRRSRRAGEPKCAAFWGYRSCSRRSGPAWYDGISEVTDLRFLRAHASRKLNACACAAGGHNFASEQYHHVVAKVRIADIDARELSLSCFHAAALTRRHHAMRSSRVALASRSKRSPWHVRGAQKHRRLCPRNSSSARSKWCWSASHRSYFAMTAARSRGCSP